MTKMVNLMGELKNDELTSKIGELPSMIWGKDDAPINTIAQTAASDVNFVARGNFNSG